MLFPLMQLFARKAFTIFVYHDVSVCPSEFSRIFNLNVYPDIFELQMRFFKKNFNIVSPDEVLNSKLPAQAALITFDDGFRSYFKNAIPIMEKYRIPSIIFLNMGPVKGETFWSGLITYLCEKDDAFKIFLERHIPEKTADKRRLFLHCSRDIVYSYLKERKSQPHEEVARFVGEFASEDDVKEASLNPLVFYGNHLFNHDVPLLLSNEDLLSSFLRNERELNKYPNYRSMVSLPFGQPGSCYCSSQVDLLLDNGAKKVCSSSGTINFNRRSSYLDRIALGPFYNSSFKIQMKILKQALKRGIHETGSYSP